MVRLRVDDLVRCRHFFLFLLFPCFSGKHIFRGKHDHVGTGEVLEQAVQLVLQIRPGDPDGRRYYLYLSLLATTRSTTPAILCLLFFVINTRIVVFCDP